MPDKDEPVKPILDKPIEPVIQEFDIKFTVPVDATDEEIAEAYRKAWDTWALDSMKRVLQDFMQKTKGEIQSDTK